MLQRHGGKISIFDFFSKLQHDTISGKCYTFTVWCKVRALKYLIIDMNFEGIQETSITASLHHHLAFLGSNANFFSGNILFEIYRIRIPVLVPSF